MNPIMIGSDKTPSHIEYLENIIETQKGIIAGLEATVNALKAALYDGKYDGIKIKPTKLYVCKYIQDDWDYESHWQDYAYCLTKEGACKAEEKFKFDLIKSKNDIIKEIKDEIEEAKKTDDNDEIELLKECLELEINSNPLDRYKFEIKEVEVKE